MKFDAKLKAMKSKFLQFILALLMCFASSNLMQAQSFSNYIISRWSLDEEIGSDSYITTDEITGAEGEIIGRCQNVHSQKD